VLVPDRGGFLHGKDSRISGSNLFHVELAPSVLRARRWQPTEMNIRALPPTEPAGRARKNGPIYPMQSIRPLRALSSLIGSTWNDPALAATRLDKTAGGAQIAPP
jgi:hypothetical protein